MIRWLLRPSSRRQFMLGDLADFGGSRTCSSSSYLSVPSSRVCTPARFVNIAWKSSQTCLARKYGWSLLSSVSKFALWAIWIMSQHSETLSCAPCSHPPVNAGAVYEHRQHSARALSTLDLQLVSLGECVIRLPVHKCERVTSVLKGVGANKRRIDKSHFYRDVPHAVFSLYCTHFRVAPGMHVRRCMHTGHSVKLTLHMLTSQSNACDQCGWSLPATVNYCTIFQRAVICQVLLKVCVCIMVSVAQLLSRVPADTARCPHGTICAHNASEDDSC